MTKKDKVYKICQKFIEDNNISCVETIHQTDWVIENAYQLVEDICDVIGYEKENEE